MASPLSKVFIVALAGFAVALADTASAQPKKKSVERAFGFAPSVPNIMVDVDEHGTPIIMRDSHAGPKKPESEDRKSKRERELTIRAANAAFALDSVGHSS
jgi:hypothetical protein